MRPRDISVLLQLHPQFVLRIAEELKREASAR
jgi:hypothetical protein